MKRNERFTLTDHIKKRLLEIQKSSKQPDIKGLLSSASSGNLHAKEQLMEVLMPFAQSYGISVAYRFINYSNMNSSYVHDNEDDIIGESMLALAETVNIFAESRNNNPDMLLDKIKKAIRTRVRSFIFSSESNEIPFSSFSDPESGNSFVDNVSSQTDNEVEYEIVAQLVKEDIIEILKTYPDQDDVQLLYAYCGLHSLTFTDLVENYGISRKEALKRIKKLIDWFRDISGII